MDSIKLATEEQVERIRATSDLGPTSRVLAMGEDLAVMKDVIEVDPIYFDTGSNNSRKLLFVWGIENFLRLTGVPAYYFNILADEASANWRQVVQTHGAKEISEGPEIRFRKDL